MSYDPNEKNESNEKSVFGVIIHSFFVVPFLIAVFSVLLFAAVRILTMEKQTVYDFLDDVKTGGLPKRWQAAFELSKVLSNPALVPTESKFDNAMIRAFEAAKTDDNRVRQYLALAMGRTGKAAFVDPLLNGIKEEKEENLYSMIYALGLLKSPKAVPAISSFLEHPDSRIRLVAVMALGNIGDSHVVNLLKKTLNDTEPNVQWDSAVALAKLHDPSGRVVLSKLLDRGYLSKFPEVDVQEQTHVVLVALEAAGQLNDPQLNESIHRLAQSDQNMNVRRLAMDIESKNQPQNIK